jgi:hypothetical protein
MAVSLTSSGVVFPASSSLSGTVNVLDDYEEGNTGTVMKRGGVAWQNYTSTGKYTRIGRIVYLMMREESSNPNASSAISMDLNYVPSGYHRTSACGLKVRIQNTYYPGSANFWLYGSSSPIPFYTDGGLTSTLNTIDSNISYCYGQWYYITTAA